MSTPDITKVQWGAVLAAACALAAAFGLNISKDKQDAIVNFVTLMVPVAFLADAVIRHGRAKAAAAKALAAKPAVKKK